MLHKILATLFVLLGTSLVWGQGSCLQNQAITSRVGFSNLAAVVPGATVTVSPGPIYTDNTLSTILSTSPIVTADNVGNYSICAAPGVQTVTITAPGFQTLTYKAGFSVEPNSVVTWTGTNIFNGTVSFNGSVTFGSAPVFNNVTSNQVTTPLVISPTGGGLFLEGANGNTGGQAVTVQGGNALLSGSGGGVTLNVGSNFGGSFSLGQIVSNTSFGTYASINLAGNYGISPEFTAVDKIAQTTTLGPTVLWTAALAGTYRITFNDKVTQAATTSSSLTVSITYTALDSTAVTLTLAGMNSAGAVATTPANSVTSTGVLVSMPYAINVAAGSTISYTATYASVGATAMQYELHIKLEAM